MNRWLMTGCAVVAFAGTWLWLQQEAAGVVRGRLAAEPAASSFWLEQTRSTGPGGVERSVQSAIGGVGTVDELIAEFDADLGEEGVAVDRAKIEQALRSDPDLRRSLGLP